jgi:hypothetical protein
MIDKQKTDFLRQKIQQIKEDTSVSTSEEKAPERSMVYFLSLFIIRYFTFYGSQYFVLSRTTYKPFGLWESFVIFYAILTFISILKKK